MKNWKDELLTAALLTLIVVLGHIIADLILQLLNIIWR